MQQQFASKTTAVLAACILCALTGGVVHYLLKQKNIPHKNSLNNQSIKSSIDTNRSIPIRILYGTQTGSAKNMALRLQQKIFALHISNFHFQTSVVDMKDYDQDNLEHEGIVIAILSTWTGGLPPPNAKVFCQWLYDMANDFRVSKTWLAHVKYAVFGLGNKEYDEDYGTAAKALSMHFSELGAKSLVMEGLGDDNVDQTASFEAWSDQLIAALCEFSSSETVNKPETDRRPWLSQKEHRRQKKKIKEKKSGTIQRNEEDDVNDVIGEFSSSEEESNENKRNNSIKENGVIDVEDLGKSMKEAQAAALSRDMITPLQRKALTKEGYKIIGTHSAVKLCRWTKHQLRGRGGCYKHTFYGITSYQCMETTPSLACANKCVFCWRHHKNPVGRVWRWKTDDPLMLVQQAIEKHQRMIKELKGLPGLIPERYEEAFTVRHCALSLVGEPIMYPKINDFVKELHSRDISSFLVTNAQFPEAIASLDPITQLYVSVDAATKDTLKAVDRPLFKDFWERFLQCLKELKSKGQRTVYRLTLVKSYNMKDLENYVELIDIGQPDFIEVKAVTYCGKSDGSDLTMKDVPYHAEVREFCEAICSKVSSKYGLATEHAHSNCVLLARKDKFLLENEWYTWIDYPKFHHLVQQYYANGTMFTAEDYRAKTPYWAVYNSREQGFDPVETRFRRSKDGKVTEYAYQATESGCG